jgi:ABC-type transporter Mla maintaining outer membrane lipid asymmetry ATPase subunit MlaF
MANFRYNPNSGQTERVERNGKDMSQVSTRFLVMNAGRLVFQGTETELQASQDPYVRKFVREGGA